ncbi:MAG: spermidine synthase [Thiobacillaceae bacterium]|nr:spermidine synthase [Thiobacillaceae bacterium]
MSFLSRRHARTRATVEISERNGVRYLHLGGPAVQSAMRLKDPFALELEYTRAILAFLLFVPEPRDIALIGLGGGSLAKYMHRHLPTSRLTALEIHAEVVAAARGYFLLPQDDERLSVRTEDGAAFVREHPDSQDVLLVDGYDAKRIVENLASPEFYRACHAMLRPGGVAAFNLWGSDTYYPRYHDRIARAFGEHTLQLPAEKKGNVIVFAFRKPLPETRLEHLERSAECLEALLGLEFPAFVARMRQWNPVSENAFIV